MRSLFNNLADAAKGPRAASLALMEANAAFTFSVYWAKLIDEEDVSESIGNGIVRRVRWRSKVEMSGVSTPWRRVVN